MKDHGADTPTSLKTNREQNTPLDGKILCLHRIARISSLSTFEESIAAENTEDGNSVFVPSPPEAYIMADVTEEKVELLTFLEMRWHSWTTPAAFVSRDTEHSCQRWYWQKTSSGFLFRRQFIAICIRALCASSLHLFPLLSFSCHAGRRCIYDSMREVWYGPHVAKKVYAAVLYWNSRAQNCKSGRTQLQFE